MDIRESDVANGNRPIDIINIAAAPNAIGPIKKPIAAVATLNAPVNATIIPNCFHVTSFVACDILPRATPKINSETDIVIIAIEPSNIAAEIGSIPITPTTTANNPVNAAIIPNCFHVTSFVACEILPRATPNRSKDTLIIAIAIAPFAISSTDSPNNLKVIIFTVIIPNTTIEPNNASKPFSEILARKYVEININPVNAVNARAEPAALDIFLLFFDNFLATGIIISTITDKSVAPKIAGTAVMTAMVKNIDVANKFPTNTVIFFAAFAPLSISFVFFISFLDKGIKLSITFSKLVIALFANFDHIEDITNSIIALFNDDASSLMSFAVLFALLKVFSFFFNERDNDNKELVLPTNISVNFPITLFLIILSILQLTFLNAFIISGAELINLITALRSLSLIFKSSFAFLNTFDISFTFWFPIMISFNEIFLSLLNASTREDNPPFLFCLSIFLIIASATFSEDLSLNLAIAGIGVLPTCFKIAFERSDIAFVIFFVSSTIF